METADGGGPPGRGRRYRDPGGAQDGYAHTAPVGRFPLDRSPYGVYELAGNVAEWTLDWYTTSWHQGADGYRVLRGGSWAAFPEGVDAVTQATTAPIKQSSIIGFRGVKDPSDDR